MNSNNIFRVLKMAMILLAVFSLVITSCTEDEDFSGDPYFNIENAPTGLSVDVDGATKNYIVRSNRPWQIVAQEENSWVKAFPAEGEDDGIFKIIVDENASFESRTMNFAFVVNGEEQPVLFLVEQEANVPYITIVDAENGATIQSAGGDVNISVQANVDWDYSIEENDWLTEQGLTTSEIKLLAAKNIGEERSVVLSVSSEQYPGLTQQVVITQQAGNILLTEDFSWLTYGSATPYVTDGETRYDSWTQEEKNHGWYSTPVEVSSNQQIVYARQGFVKLGKTNYGGDLISPKFDIDGAVNLKVTFKAATYISAGGNVDDRILKVYALGAGEASVSQLTIDNIPNSKTEDEAGVVNDIWAEDRAYSFTVTGATSDTQVKFLGGDYDLQGVGQGKNRIFLDDIKIEIIE